MHRILITLYEREKGSIFNVSANGEKEQHKARRNRLNEKCKLDKGNSYCSGRVNDAKTCSRRIAYTVHASYGASTSLITARVRQRTNRRKVQFFFFITMSHRIIS